MNYKSTLATHNLLLLSALGLPTVAIHVAQAQTFSVVHSFSGTSDGANPLNGLTAGKSGDLYGTTNAGGAYNGGSVFSIVNGVETLLHSFKGGADGQYPQGALILDKAGNIYGTTTGGGAHNAGTVFRISTTGRESILYSFGGAPDGSAPDAGLTRDSAGNLYGTTTAGGTNGSGTVFELMAPNPKGSGWKETVLYSFGATGDGTVPVGGVAFDSAGNLYGTTSAGGTYGFGDIFELTPSGSGWTETILHQFQNAEDGGVPYAGLIRDKSGNFYGAATDGGLQGGGTIFELTPASGGWTFTVLYSNPGWGIAGAFRDLVMDAAGNIYGTTHCDGAYSAGTVYKLTPVAGTWNYTSLYVFTGGSDGLYAFSNLVLAHGSVYGTTNLGGANGQGVVFEIVL